MWRSERARGVGRAVDHGARRDVRVPRRPRTVPDRTTEETGERTLRSLLVDLVAESRFGWGREQRTLPEAAAQASRNGRRPRSRRALQSGNPTVLGRAGHVWTRCWGSVVRVAVAGPCQVRVPSGSRIGAPAAGLLEPVVAAAEGVEVGGGGGAVGPGAGVVEVAAFGGAGAAPHAAGAVPGLDEVADRLGRPVGAGGEGGEGAGLGVEDRPGDLQRQGLRRLAMVVASTQPRPGSWVPETAYPGWTGAMRTVRSPSSSAGSSTQDSASRLAGSRSA